MSIANRHYLLVEEELVPGSNRNLLTTFHGLFTSMDKAQAALRTVAETLLRDYTIGEMSARGYLADPQDPNYGKKVSIYIQMFGTTDKVII